MIYLHKYDICPNIRVPNLRPPGHIRPAHFNERQYNCPHSGKTMFWPARFYSCPEKVGHRCDLTTYLHFSLRY